MAAFNFLKEASLYIVHNSLQYNIDISRVSFSQTFTEDSIQVRTLHTDNLFEASTINKANPANFQIEANVFKEADPGVSLLLSKAIDYGSFDIYISTLSDIFKVEYAVITNIAFTLEKNKPITLQIDGEARKVSKVGVVGSYTIPGTAQSVPDPKTYLTTTSQVITLGGTDISDSVYKISVELQNEISWNPYVTVQGGLQATSASTSMFPTTYVIEKRILAGNIGKYLLDDNDDDLQDWSTNTSLRIKAGQYIGGTLYGFDFNMPNCSFTNRLEVANIFTQNYDWRMTNNSTALSSIITKL